VDLSLKVKGNEVDCFFEEFVLLKLHS